MADWINDFEVAMYGASVLVGLDFSKAVATFLTEALSSGHAVLLKDEASFACTQFLGLGQDRQALMLPALQGLKHDRDQYFDREHPDKDPFFGLNDNLTARWNAGKGGAA